MADSVIQTSGLTCGYGARDVLTDVDLTFSHGFTAIVGKNGCGKSTLLRAIGGRLPYRGSVTVDGVEARDYAPKALARKLAVLPQVRDVPHIPVRQLVEHGRFPYLGFPRVLRAGDRQAVDEAMRLTRVESFAATDTAALSGGERQRVYLAMALCQQTEILLLDEPTTFLDMRDAWEMLTRIKRLSESRTVVAVLHDLDAALRMADRVVLLDGGKVVTVGAPEAVFAAGAIERVYGVRAAKTQTEQGAFYRFYVDGEIE